MVCNGLSAGKMKQIRAGIERAKNIGGGDVIVLPMPFFFSSDVFSHRT